MRDSHENSRGHFTQDYSAINKKPCFVWSQFVELLNCALMHTYSISVFLVDCKFVERFNFQSFAGWTISTVVHNRSIQLSFKTIHFFFRRPIVRWTVVRCESRVEFGGLTVSGVKEDQCLGLKDCGLSSHLHPSPCQLIMSLISPSLL